MPGQNDSRFGLAPVWKNRPRKSASLSFLADLQNTIRSAYSDGLIENGQNNLFAEWKRVQV
jgi:hypothetical protein